MIERIFKTEEQIKERIEFWFCKYHGKTKSQFKGSELFTFFDLIEKPIQKNILLLIKLNENEIPVLVLKCTDSYIINTTERFIKTNQIESESIYYSHFKHHEGYKILYQEKATFSFIKSIKTEGYFEEFGIKTQNGTTVYWTIPTGKPGFAFWNITKKCSLIGRKYTTEIQ